MEAKKTEERLTVEVQSMTEKFTRAQGTIRSARGRLQNLTQEKEQVGAKNIFLCVYRVFLFFVVVVFIIYTSFF